MCENKYELKRRIWNALQVARRLRVLEEKPGDAWAIEELVLFLVSNNNIRSIKEINDIKLKPINNYI
ncbi:MAG TPA: hypothetical protein ENN33_07085 [Ignavibacteria bacterium]|nr:hypothetical protein [Ignavibacteria bacterium]